MPHLSTSPRALEGSLPPPLPLCPSCLLACLRVPAIGNTVLDLPTSLVVPGYLALPNAFDLGA